MEGRGLTGDSSLAATQKCSIFIACACQPPAVSSYSITNLTAWSSTNLHEQLCTARRPTWPPAPSTMPACPARLQPSTFLATPHQSPNSSRPGWTPRRTWAASGHRLCKPAYCWLVIACRQGDARANCCVHVSSSNLICSSQNAQQAASRRHLSHWKHNILLSIWLLCISNRIHLPNIHTYSIPSPFYSNYFSLSISSTRYFGLKFGFLSLQRKILLFMSAFRKFVLINSLDVFLHQLIKLWTIQWGSPSWAGDINSGKVAL